MPNNSSCDPWEEWFQTHAFGLAAGGVILIANILIAFFYCVRTGTCPLKENLLRVSDELRHQRQDRLEHDFTHHHHPSPFVAASEQPRSPVYIKPLTEATLGEIVNERYLNEKKNPPHYSIPPPSSW